MIFQTHGEPQWPCIQCDRLVGQHEWEQNNGVCDHCPPLEPAGNPFERKAAANDDVLES